MQHLAQKYAGRVLQSFEGGDRQQFLERELEIVGEIGEQHIVAIARGLAEALPVQQKNQVTRGVCLRVAQQGQAHGPQHLERRTRPIRRQADGLEHVSQVTQTEQPDQFVEVRNVMTQTGVADAEIGVRPWGWTVSG